MALSSLELIQRCEERGLLTKEAAQEVEAIRKDLIKEAVRGSLWGKSKHVVEEGAKKAKKKGFFDKLFGGPELTPPKGKKSGWGDAASNIAKLMALGGLTAGATSGLNFAVGAVKDKRQRKLIQDSFGQIYNEEPGLHTADPEKVQRTFGLIARYAPSMAADPVVAAATTHAFIQRPVGTIMEDVKRLAEVEATITSSKKPTEVFKPDKMVLTVTKAVSGYGGGDDDE